MTKNFKVILKDKKDNSSISWIITHECRGRETLQNIKKEIKADLENIPTVASYYNIGRITEIK